MKSLYLMPVGAPDERALDILKHRFEQELGWDVRIAHAMAIPNVAYDAKREQYEAIHILRAAIEAMPAAKPSKPSRNLVV